MLRRGAGVGCGRVWWRIGASVATFGDDRVERKGVLVPRKPTGYWDDEGHQYQFMEEFRKSMNVRNEADWDRVCKKDLLEYGGRQLITKHRTLLGILRAVYPNSLWTPFTVPSLTPAEDWSDHDVQREFLYTVSAKEGLRSPLELTERQIFAHRGWRLVRGRKLRTEWILRLMPELDIEIDYWREIEHQRELQIGRASCRERC